MEQPHGRAVPFVVYQNKRFIISQEAKEIFAKEEMKNIGVISLVGKYRTGKSFLLNRVLLNQKNEKGFSVGPTIKPCTKGIWMWSEPILIQNNHSKEKFPAFFIDTEGLGAYDEEINHDSRIFLIAILISSLFIYNSFGNIDETTINSLSFVLNLSKTIKLRSDSSSNSPEVEMAKYFPSLLWLLRDFSLKLEDSDGNTITAKQYLENAMSLHKGGSESIEEKNKVRKMITTFFPERDCFVMVRPVEDEKDLQNLQSIQDDLIRREFLDQAETLRNKVMKKVKPKMFNNKLLSGSMLIELVQSILDSINQGNIPIIENSWNYVVHNENVKTVDKLIKTFKSEIEKFKAENKDKQNFFSDLEIFQKKIQKELIDRLIMQGLSDGESQREYVEKLKDKMSEEFSRFMEENSKLYQTKLNEIIEKSYKKLSDTFETEKYSKNYYTFFQDLEEFRDLCDKSTPDFPMKKEIIFEKMLGIIKKFIEMTFIKNKLLNEKELLQTKNDLQALTNKFNLKVEEYENLKLETKEIIERLNTQIVDYKMKDKSIEERIRTIESEKKLEKESHEKILRETRKEFEAKLDKLRQELKAAQDESRSKDEQVLKMKLNEEKHLALNLQKIEFLEKEINAWKERYEILKLDTEAYHRDIIDLNKEIEIIKDRKKELELQLERTQKDTSPKGVTSSSSELVHLIKEQLLSSKQQMEENKRMYEDIIRALKENHNDRDIKEKKLNNHEDFVCEMKCRNCLASFPPNHFEDHTCRKAITVVRKSSTSDKFKIKIIKGIMNKDELGKPFIEYVINISYNVHNWKVVKKFNQFASLHYTLRNLYKNDLKLQNCSIFTKVNENSTNNFHENKTKQLEKYLRELSDNELISKSKPFRKFLESEEYVEEDQFEFEEESKRGLNMTNEDGLIEEIQTDVIKAEIDDTTEEKKLESEDKQIYKRKNPTTPPEKKDSTKQNKIVTMNININKDKQTSSNSLIQIAPRKKTSLNTSVVIEKTNNIAERLVHSASKSSK